ncbi:MAG: chemotaxis protein CheX [Planctomycetales bacterium]|nr:chemotaxis protein CheX [Planctomycetales bacterium]
MKITDDELVQVTLDVCDTMLGLDIVAREKTVECDPTLVATVYITGTWNAAVDVGVCDAAAKSIGVAMFCCDEPEDDEVSDAVAEVVNMIGGNIKGMIEGDCDLSIPCVGDRFVEAEDGDAVGVAFKVGGGKLDVFVRQIDPAEVVTSP